jgi:hypothetical protein
VSLEIRITERVQKKGEQNRCMKMGMNVHWYQRISLECAGTEIAVPYQFHCADLTTVLVRAKEDFDHIHGWHVQLKTDFKHLYQLFISL